MLNIMDQSSNFIGMIGVILTLVAYYLLNVGKLESKSKTYLLMNLFGSLLLVFSLIFHWNLSSFLVEITWMFISGIGLYRATSPSFSSMVNQDAESPI